VLTKGVCGAPGEAALTRPAASTTWMSVLRPSVASSTGSSSAGASVTSCRLMSLVRVADALSEDDSSELLSNRSRAAAAMTIATATTIAAANADRVRTPQLVGRSFTRTFPASSPWCSARMHPAARLSALSQSVHSHGPHNGTR